MAVAAVMLVKDESDIIRYTVEHLLEQVDRVYVSDNMSSDGTTEILHDLRDEHGTDRVRLGLDEDPGYWQSRKTTEMAMVALEDGFRWVVPCDADEWWHVGDYSRTIKQFLEGLAPDVQIVTAHVYNHIPTAADPVASCFLCGGAGEALVPAGQHVINELRRDEHGSWVVCPRCHGESEPNPFRRIQFRQREFGALDKVACRLRPDLVIHAGNHDASTGGTGLSSGGLVVRHFSWRTEAQYVRKIRNGQAAYAATDLPADTGTHWRMWEGLPDEAIADNFRAWFWSPDPYRDDTLTRDPAPGV